MFVIISHACDCHNPSSHLCTACFYIFVYLCILYHYFYFQPIQSVPQVQGRRLTLSFSKIRKYVNTGKLLQITCLQSQVLDFFLPRTSRYSATLFTFPIVKVMAALPR
jgi:hypothetical protein